MEEVLQLLVPFLVVIVVMSFILFTIEVVTRWIIFNKAGESGWKAIIPIYSDYTMYKVSKSKKFFFLFYAAVLLSAIITGVTNDMTLSTSVSTIVWILALLFELVAFSCRCIQSIRLANAFNQSIAFGICLILFRPIVMLILAFSKMEYETEEFTE